MKMTFRVYGHSVLSRLHHNFILSWRTTTFPLGSHLSHWKAVLVSASDAAPASV